MLNRLRLYFPILLIQYHLNVGLSPTVPHWPIWARNRCEQHTRSSVTCSLYEENPFDLYEIGHVFADWKGWFLLNFLIFLTADREQAYGRRDR